MHSYMYTLTHAVHTCTLTHYQYTHAHSHTCSTHMYTLTHAVHTCTLSHILNTHMYTLVHVLNTRHWNDFHFAVPSVGKPYKFLLQIKSYSFIYLTHTCNLFAYSSHIICCIYIQYSIIYHLCSIESIGGTYPILPSRILTFNIHCAVQSFSPQLSV